VGSELVERYQMAGQLSLRYNGGRQTRDIYAAAGYDQKIGYEQYVLRYLRQDVARRVVNVVADDSWRLAPQLLDGLDLDTAQEESEFTRTWLLLADNQAEEAETRRGLLHYLHRLDKVSGIGRYAVLFLGLRDGQPSSAEARPGSLSSPADLLFASVFDEASAKVLRYESDRQSPRYGKPTLYQITERNDAGTMVTFEAHWTRCIHVADNVLASDLAGSPRLEAIWNRLIDLDKLAASTGEAGWRAMVPGYAFTTKDGYELGGDSTERAAQLDEFTNDLRRYIELNGMEVQELGGQLQDPSGAVGVVLKLISAGTGIPLRKLTGSEMGQLASGQDDDNWTDVIEARQQQHVTPAIIRPTVNRLLWLGVLPQPASGEFVVWWPSQRQKSQKEMAEIADRAASALQKVRAKVAPRLFAETYLPDLPADAVDEEAEEPAPSPLLMGGGPGAGAGQGEAQDGQDAGDDDAPDGEEGGTPATNAGRFRHFAWPVGYP
jgi:hypothetical protein